MINREEEIKKYKRSLRGKSINTVDNYGFDIGLFLNWIDENNLEDNLENATNEEVQELMEDYKDELFRNYDNIKTINRKYNSLNAYLEFKGFTYRIKSENIQTQTFIDDMLSNEDLKLIVDLSRKENDLRTTALIYGLFYTGARVSELLQLRVKDLGKDEVMVKGKGAKHRKILIPEKLKDILIEYKEKARLNKNTDNLFTSTRGALTRTTVNKSLKKYSDMSDIDFESKLHPHALRHLFTKNLIEKGVSISAVKQLLGHSLTTTDIYAQLSKKDLLAVLNSLDL